MNLLRIEGSGPTTSFRYPFFMMGRQPSFAMPPPATIYGHICSALGDWVDPADVRFGYWFVSDPGGSDLEHIHLLSASGGSFELDGQRFPKSMEGAINPFKRDLLFRPKLVLYLDKPEWLDAFRNPRYTLVLGRSQDLFTYTDVRTIDASIGAAYLEHTILPFAFQSTARATSAVMPRLLDYHRRREPDFQPYLVLTGRVWAPEPMPVDPLSPAAADPQRVERRRGILLHSFTD